MRVHFHTALRGVRSRRCGCRSRAWLRSAGRALFGGPRRVARSDVVCDWSFEQAAGMIEAGTNPETTRKAPLAATGLPDFVLRQFKLGQPSHQQLYGILQAGIRDGSLAAGLRLPPTGAGAHAGHRAQHGGPCLRTTDLRRLCAGARGARHLRRRRVSPARRGGRKIPAGSQRAAVAPGRAHGARALAARNGALSRPACQS